MSQLLLHNRNKSPYCSNQFPLTSISGWWVISVKYLVRILQFPSSYAGHSETNWYKLELFWLNLLPQRNWILRQFCTLLISTGHQNKACKRAQSILCWGFWHHYTKVPPGTMKWHQLVYLQLGVYGFGGSYGFKSIFVSLLNSFATGWLYMSEEVSPGSHQLLDFLRNPIVKNQQWRIVDDGGGGERT